MLKAMFAVRERRVFNRTGYLLPFEERVPVPSLFCNLNCHLDIETDEENCEKSGVD